MDKSPRPTFMRAKVGSPTVACLCVSSGERRLVGLTRFELVTPRLSSVCSNQLSYRPVKRSFKEPPDFAFGFVEAGDPAARRRIRLSQN